jgi:hypothetical protein
MTNHFAVVVDPKFTHNDVVNGGCDFLESACCLSILEIDVCEASGHHAEVFATKMRAHLIEGGKIKRPKKVEELRIPDAKSN